MERNHIILLVGIVVLFGLVYLEYSSLSYDTKLLLGLDVDSQVKNALGQKVIHSNFCQLISKSEIENICGTQLRELDRSPSLFPFWSQSCAYSSVGDDVEANNAAALGLLPNTSRRLIFSETAGRPIIMYDWILIDVSTGVTRNKSGLNEFNVGWYDVLLSRDDMSGVVGRYDVYENRVNYTQYNLNVIGSLFPRAAPMPTFVTITSSMRTISNATPICDEMGVEQLSRLLAERLSR